MTHEISRAEIPTAGISRPSAVVTARNRWSWFGAPALYLLLSVLWLGRFVLAGPRGTIGAGPDVQIFLWGLRWWPYAIGHGIDPLVSKYVWPPHGSGVLWTTTVPLLSLLASPVTLLFGPAASWNLLCVLAPALAAWAAYWLCLELTEALVPATVGGLLFGFSSYEVAQSSAHLQVTMIALVPVAALVAVRYARGRYGGWGLAARVAGLTVAQFLISPEVLATLVFMAALAGVAAFVMIPAARTRLVAGVGWTACGLLAGVLISLPLLIPMLNGMPNTMLNPPSEYSVDLLNLVAPTQVTALGGAWAIPVTKHFTGNLAEQTGYLGVPLLAAAVIAITVMRRQRPVLVLGLVTGVAILLSLGPGLQVNGAHTVWLPGDLLTGLPVLKQAIPDRFSAYAALGIAVLVALWLARPAHEMTFRGGRPATPWSGWRWLLLALAVACLIPNPQREFWWRPTPAWIAHNDLARLIPAGDTVVFLPFGSGDDRGLWAQAAADMRFRVDDRWLQVIPAYYARFAFEWTLEAKKHTRRMDRFLRRDLCWLDADYAVVWRHAPRRSQTLAGLRIPRPASMDGLLVYRLPESLCSPADRGHELHTRA